MAFFAVAVLLLAQSGEPAHAFVELSAEPASACVGEPLRITVRFGIEELFLRHNLLQLFTRPLDVPVQLELAWDGGLRGAEFVELPGAAPDWSALAPHPSFALGEEIVKAARTTTLERDGQRFVALEFERTLIPTAPGALTLPAPVLHFAVATRFRDDLVSGSVPLDRSDAQVAGAPLTIEVTPLPSEGRPAGFQDAVGEFTLRAEAAPLDLAQGERVALTLVIEGSGNLAQLTPPRLDGLAGLHLLGLSEEAGEGLRTLHAELVVESPRTHEIPSITLLYYDPRSRSYRSADSAAIPLAVRAKSGTPEPATGGAARWVVFTLIGIVTLALIRAAIRRARPR
ncbi:MAG: BatD family protein [Planctomycetes bacterium]|nr:BatD family protein [Planctomycetota bacterium]